MKRNTLLAISLLSSIALPTLPVQSASADDSFQYNGYFRSGVLSDLDGGPGDGGSCFALNHPSNDGLYYRLGNECRDYTEVAFTKNKSTNGIDFSGVVRLEFATTNESATSQAGFSQRNRETYVEAANVFGNDVKVWVGRRYYRAIAVGDVHIIDAFHVNSSGQGAGFTDIPLGGDTKLHVAYIAANDSDQQQQVLDLRADIGVGAAGRLKAVSQTMVRNDADGAPDAPDGQSLTLQWDKNLGGIYDQKTVIQFGTDAAANNPACWGSDGVGAGNCYSTSAADDGRDGLRIFNNGTWSFGTVRVNTMFMFEDIDADSNGAGEREVVSVGIRPHVPLSKYWSFLSEIGWHEIDRGTTTDELQKITLALQLTGDAYSFWERPSIRFYVSQFDWNDDAAGGPSNLTVEGQPGQTDATIWGIQTEFWF